MRIFLDPLMHCFPAKTESSLQQPLLRSCPPVDHSGTHPFHQAGLDLDAHQLREWMCFMVFVSSLLLSVIYTKSSFLEDDAVDEMMG